MEGIPATLALTEGLHQQQMALLAVKLAAQSEQQIAGLLAQAAQAGTLASANPAHLGQNLDVHA